MTTNPNPVEVLRQAADIIEHVGHSTEFYEEMGWIAPEDPSGDSRYMPLAYCAYGAMTLAATKGQTANFADSDVGVSREAKAITDVLNLGVDCGDYFTAVTQWNDSHSARAVALGLRLAADRPANNTEGH